MPEIHINESAAQYRNNNQSGPKYLLRGPNVDIGLILLLPGEDLATHYHRAIEEDFYTLEGEAEAHFGDRSVRLAPGDLLHLPAGQPHYLKNNGAKPWKAVIVKAPFDPQDKIDIDWLPGQPVDGLRID